MYISLCVHECNCACRVQHQKTDKHTLTYTTHAFPCPPKQTTIEWHEVVERFLEKQRSGQYRVSISQEQGGLLNEARSACVCLKRQSGSYTWIHAPIAFNTTPTPSSSTKYRAHRPRHCQPDYAAGELFDRPHRPGGVGPPPRVARPRCVVIYFSICMRAWAYILSVGEGCF